MRALMIAGVVMLGLAGVAVAQGSDEQPRMGACLVNGAAKIPRAPGLVLGKADVQHFTGADMVKVLEDATFSYEINSGELDYAIYALGPNEGRAFDEARAC